MNGAAIAGVTIQPFERGAVDDRVGQHRLDRLQWQLFLICSAASESAHSTELTACTKLTDSTRRDWHGGNAEKSTATAALNGPWLTFRLTEKKIARERFQKLTKRVNIVDARHQDLLRAMFGCDLEHAIVCDPGQAEWFQQEMQCLPGRHFSEFQRHNLIHRDPFLDETHRVKQDFALDQLRQVKEGVIERKLFTVQCDPSRERFQDSLFLFSSDTAGVGSRRNRCRLFLVRLNQRTQRGTQKSNCQKTKGPHEILLIGWRRRRMGKYPQRDSNPCIRTENPAS